jgi:hypothetical protein
VGLITFDDIQFKEKILAVVKFLLKYFFNVILNMFKGLSCMVAFGTKDNLKFNVCSKLRFGNSLYQGLGFMFGHFEFCKKMLQLRAQVQMIQHY